MFKVNIGIKAHHRAIVMGFNQSPFTPDIAKLEKYEWQHLFLSDEWMRARRQNEVVSEGVHRCTVFTKDKFNFVVKSTDGTPVAIPDPDGHVIKGELISFATRADRSHPFIKLDKLKLNGLQFVRQRVDVIDPHRTYEVRENVDVHGRELPPALQGKKCFIGEEELAYIGCWMYIGAPEYWLDMMHQQPFLFNKVPTFKPKKEKTWLDDYYFYQNPDR